MAQRDAGRPSTTEAAAWYADGPFAAHVREHRIGGSAPVHVFDIAQPGGEFRDPPLDTLMLVQSVSRFRIDADLGAGRFRAVALPERFFVIPKATPARIDVLDRQAIRAFALPPEGLRPAFEEVWPSRTDPLDLGPLHQRLSESRTVAFFCARIWAEAAGGGPTARLFVDSALSSLAVALARLAGAAPAPRPDGLEAWQLRRVLERMRDHLAEDPSLADLADSVGLPPQHFARAFKASTGMAPHRYQRRLRLERAKALLSTTSWQITDIATAVGYSAPGALARSFLRETGMSPSSWRRRHRD